MTTVKNFYCAGEAGDVRRGYPTRLLQFKRTMLNLERLEFEQKAKLDRAIGRYERENRVGWLMLVLALSIFVPAAVAFRGM